jgi:hypothetical protein
MPVNLRSLVLVLVWTFAVSTASWAQTPAPAADRTKASVFSAADLAAALAKLSDERPASSVRVFSLAPYNVNVERRLPRPQGASLHETQALTSPTRNGTNLSGPGIEGGVRQTFSKGVPSGIPHQFVDITAPVQLLSIDLPNARP